MTIIQGNLNAVDAPASTSISKASHGVRLRVFVLRRYEERFSVGWLRNSAVHIEFAVTHDVSPKGRGVYTQELT